MERISFLQLENEPITAFQKFEIYRDMGRHRSLRRAYQLYLAQKATEGVKRFKKVPLFQGSAPDKPAYVPGQWIRLSEKYHWNRRVGAYEFDRDLKDQEKKGATNSTEVNLMRTISRLRKKTL
jgi:hypothetical protein